MTFPHSKITTADGATLGIYHQGAHISSWIPSPERGEQLFMAKRSFFEAGKAIRGGVPICWPQFAAFGSGIKHGFVRTQAWQPVAIEEAKGLMHFALTSSEDTVRIWPHAFRLDFRVQASANRLDMTLSVTNTDSSAWHFSGALHTYFAVSDFTQVSIDGLSPSLYWDNGSPLSARFPAPTAALQLSQALDRVYFDAAGPLTLRDGNQQKQIEHAGFTDVVVWNPGPEGAKHLADMDDAEFTGMLCIEAALVENPVSLNPGEIWSGRQSIIL